MRDIGGERKKKKKDLTYFQFEFQQDKKEQSRTIFNDGQEYSKIDKRHQPTDKKC